MDNQNQQIGIPTSPYKKSKKKLIIAAVAGTVLLATIILGTATSFMGSMKGALKDQNKSDGTILNPNGVTDSATTGVKENDTNTKAVLNVTGTLKAITDTTILATKHVYIDSFEIEQDADGNYTNFTTNICTSKDDQDDLGVRIYLATSNGSIPASVMSDTVDIPAGNCDDENFLITYELERGTTYTGAIEISPTTTDTVASDNTKEVEFTTSMGLEVIDVGEFLKDFDLTEDDEMEIAGTKIVDVGSLASASLNKDDIYINDVSVNDDHSFIYVTIVSTETDLLQLPVNVVVTKGSAPLEDKYFYTDIAAGSDAAVELSISMDNFTTELTAGSYTITATISSDQSHNEVSSNDSKEISFTIINKATGVYDISGLDNDENETGTSVVATGTTYIDPDLLIDTKDDDETLVATESQYLDIDIKDDEQTWVAIETQNLDIDKEEEQTWVATESQYLDTGTKEDTKTTIKAYDANTLLTDLQQNLETEAAATDEPASGQKLTDIPGTWYEESVTRLTNLGIVSGYPDGTFGGGKAMNRAEITKIVVEAFEYPEYTDCGITFSDVTDTSTWYYDYVYTAACYGIVSGYSDGTFGTDNQLNRAEALKVIMEASMIADMPSAEYYIGDSDTWTNPYLDVRSFDWFYTYVMEAYYGNIITTASDNMYRPGDVINRAETATLIDKIITILSTVTI